MEIMPDFYENDFYRNLEFLSLEPSASASVFDRRPKVFRPSASATAEG